jgi:hypothetical protein
MGTITISFVDTDNDDFTASAAHLLTNGDSVKMSADVAPGGTVNGTIYYARVINSTKFSIHPTRANAKDGINQIAISSTGTAVTFLTGAPQIKDHEFTRLVNHTGYETIASEFSDYSRELVFVEEVSTEYSRVDVLHSTAIIPVFGKGLTTSPTYIFTSGEPKAAPGIPEVTEVWIVS